MYINTLKCIHSRGYRYGLSKSDLFVIVLFLENTKSNKSIKKNQKGPKMSYEHYRIQVNKSVKD